MKRYILVGLFGLAACGTLQQTASALQLFQPVAAALACDAQATANQTGNATASFVAGTFCNDLASGAALPNAIAILAGQTVTLPTSTGTVTLPVPAATPKS